MKHTKTTKSLATLLLAASATTLTAIERPVPAEQPKEKKAQEAKEDALPMLEVSEVKIANRPYLGVMGNSTSEAMSAQLGLDAGASLTLLFVDEASPAGKAGLKRHDIITKIGGVKIGDQNQLRAAILKHKPNQKVELNYISGGKALTKQIELGAAPMKNLHAPQLKRGEDVLPKMNQQKLNGGIPLNMLKNLPPEQRKQLEQLLEGNLNKLDFRNLNNLDVDQLQKHFKGFKQGPKFELRMDDLMKQGVQKGTMKMIDPEGSMTLESDGDKKSIELHDTEGKLLYKGPFNNEADKLKIPENLRERANKLNLKGMPKVEILPNKGLKGLEKMEVPKELQDLLKNLEGQGQGGNAQGFVLPQGGKLGKGGMLQKFEFNLGAGGFGKNSSKSMMGPDGNRYSQSESKDGKEIEIKGSKGELLYSGPYNSSADKLMVPEEYRPTLEKLEAMGGFLKGDLKNGLELKLGAPEE